MTAASDSQLYMTISDLSDKQVVNEQHDSESHFFRFSESSLWDVQAAILEQGVSVSYPVETTYLAKVYTEIILSYWKDMMASGQIDTGEPLYIFELGSGSGRFSWYMIHRLQQSLKETDAGNLKPVYLISDPSMANLEYCRQHPKLKPYIESRCVDLVHWDGCSDTTLYLQNSFKTIDRATVKNPVVFIADYHFGRLKQELYYIHYGHFFEGKIRITENTIDDHSPNHQVSPYQNSLIDYAWYEMDTSEAEQPCSGRSIKQYTDRLDSTSLLIPTGAVDSIQSMKKISNKKMLLLSVDNGYHNEKDVRFRGEPEISFFGSFYLPVNYHYLNRYADDSSSFIHTSQSCQDTTLFSAIVSNEYRTELPAVKQACQTGLSDSNPQDQLVMSTVSSRMAASLSSCELMSLIRQSNYDPSVAGQILSVFSLTTRDLLPDERLEWITVLEKVWSGFYPSAEELEFMFGTGLLAMDLVAWGLAKEIFQSVITIAGNDPASLYNLGFIYYNTGEMKTAIYWLEQSLLAEPANSQAQLLLNDIEIIEKEWSKLNWYNNEICFLDEIRLIPLGPEHSGQLFYQYRDISIGILTRLPEFKNESDVRLWIETERKEPRKTLFAVYHQSYGFSGVVSMSMLKNTGYFYFWTGIDYQGQGIGRKAASCLMNAMKELCRVETIYTSAYVDNIKSQITLSALEFDRLPFQAEDPDEDVLFYRKGDKTEPDCAFDELRNLLEDTNSPMVLKTL